MKVGTQGKNLREGLLAVPHNTASNPKQNKTNNNNILAEEAWQELWRSMLAGWQAGLCSASFLIHIKTRKDAIHRG